MQLIAVSDFHHGLREGAEVLRRGDTFTPAGTGTMNAAEHARSLINCGSCCTFEDWPKLKDKTQAGYDAAKAEVQRLNLAAEAHKAAKAARAA